MGGFSPYPRPLCSVPTGAAKPCSNSSRSGSLLPLWFQNHVLTFHFPEACPITGPLEPTWEVPTEVWGQSNPPSSLSV